MALTVPTGGTHLNLNEPQLSSLKYAADHDIPLAIGADGGTVFYMWAMVGSGLSADPTMSAYGATGVNQCGVVYATTRLDVPETAPHGANGLVINRLGGGTATLRLWRTG